MPSLVRRWLLHIAALVMLASPVTTWAAAGAYRTATCCCPDPRTCPCHDHGGRGDHGPSLRRCGPDGAHLVTAGDAPALVPPPPIAAHVADRRTPIVLPEPAAMPAGRVVHPETPPF